MLGMTAVIVDYMFKMCFWLLISHKQGPQTLRNPG